jgi:hypothetical protein
MAFTNTLEFIQQNCPKYDGTGNSNDLITWLRRIKPHVMYLQGNEPRRALEFLLVGDAREYYVSLEARPPSVLELGSIFCPKLDKDGTLRQHFQRSTSTLSSNVQLPQHPPRPGTPETLEITHALSAPSSHSARPHHFHSQHEQDYFLAKSISSSSDFTLVSTPSINTLPCTEVDSFWPEGLTSWYFEPLPPRSLRISLDDALIASPKILSSSIPEKETKITFSSDGCMVSSPISQTKITPSHTVSLPFLRRPRLKNPISSLRSSYPASSTSFLPRQCWFSAVVLVLVSLIWFTLKSARFSVRLDGHDAAQALLPVRQLWHLMIP